MKPKIKLPSRTIKHLSKSGIKHELLKHKTAYTAMDTASTMKRKMEEVVKSLLVKADQDYWLVLLPADHNLDFAKLKSVLGKHKQKQIKVIKIPGEKVARNILKIRNEAVAAFGGMYKLPVVMEKKLEKVKKAIFSSDSFNHSVEMTVKDFINLEKAVLGSFGVKRKYKIAKPKRKVSPKKKKK